MADAYEALSSLRAMLKAKRTERLEEMAKGLTPERYNQLVGRTRELADCIDRIDAQIKSINGGGDIDGGKASK